MTDDLNPYEAELVGDDTNDEAADLDSHHPPSKPAKALVPPIWVWIVVAIFIGLIGIVRTGEVTGDHAIINILTLILAFLGSCAFSSWFVFLSGYSVKARLAGISGVVGGIALFFTFFRIGHVSGELVPSFRPRFGTPADAMLDAPEVVASKSADLPVASDQDFPQFLGPNRNAVVSNIRLVKDWSANPPEKLWRQPIGAGWTGFVAVNGSAVTMEQRGDEQLVTCYDIDTGTVIWTHSQQNRHHTILGGTGPRSTPTIHDGRVYALGPTGVLLCLDGATGDVVWKDDLLARYKVPKDEDSKAIAWGRSNSPLIVDDLVVIPAGGPHSGSKVSLVAFDRLTRELAWEAGTQQVSYASPTMATLGDQRMIVCVNENNVTGHEPTTGEVLWNVEWWGRSNGEANVSQPTLFPDGRLLLSKAYGKGSALWKLTSSADVPISTELVWENKAALKTKFTNLVVRDGFAYGLSDGILECVEIETGEKQWKKGRYGHGQLLLVDDVLMVQAESGDVVLVDASPESFREITKFAAISGKTWNNLCLYGDRLLVRNAEEAACYRLPLAD